MSFLWSYPNMIPLSRSAVERIAGRLAAYRFEAVYGIFWDLVIPKDGSAVVARSAERYITAITGEGLAATREELLQGAPRRAERDARDAGAPYPLA